jgi:hypothetical protein
MIERKNIYRVNFPKQLQTCPLKMLKRDVLDFDRSGLQELLHREMRNGHDAGMAVVQRVSVAHALVSARYHGNFVQEATTAVKRSSIQLLPVGGKHKPTVHGV